MAIRLPHQWCVLGGGFDEGQNLVNWLTANLIGFGMANVNGHSGQQGGLWENGKKGRWFEREMELEKWREGEMERHHGCH